MNSPRDLKRETQYTLRKHHIVPRRENGQNFLIDLNVVADLLQASNIQQVDHVLEVGAGLGVITQELLLRTEHVIAVEMDRAFIPILERFSVLHPSFQCINDDIFRVNIPELFPNTPYHVVSNIPYNISSKFIRMLCTMPFAPVRMSLILQKEVSQRIVAESPNASLLSLSVQLYTTPKLIRIIPRSAFWPVPEVDSAILTIERLPQPRVPDPELLMRLARMGFAGKRKQLHNTLSNGLNLSVGITKQRIIEQGISPTIRPQELTIPQWQLLVTAFRSELFAKSKNT